MTRILPCATLGILGGGQLGSMTAVAARSVGYRVHVLDPDPHCSAEPVADRIVTAAFDDPAGAADLASQCQVVTIEIEKIGLASMEAAARHAPVRPGAHVLAVVQDRARQKEWLERQGLPVGPWRLADDAAALEAAVSALGPSFAKATRGGYDGRGQARVDKPGQAAAAWAALGCETAVVEQALELEAEVSVLVARRPAGETAVYPAALNHHEAQILAWSVLPAPLPPAVLAEAEEIARSIADVLDVVGLVAVELFLLRDGRLLVNELAPRPHNTFHATQRGCATSQFEQLVRAVCDLPLGSVEVVRPAAIANLLGDLWLSDQPPAFADALGVPGVRLHLYGKRDARPGRKMGHLSAIGDTAEQAVARVQQALECLKGRC